MAELFNGPDPEESLSDGNVQEEDNQEQTEGEFNLVRRALRLFKEAKADREEASKHWERYYRLWAGDQWHGIQVDEWKSQPQVNFLHSTVETITSTVTDQKPQIVVFPRSNKIEQIEVAEVLTKIFTDAWSRMRMGKALKNVVRNAGVYGTGIFKTAFNNEADNIDLHSVLPDQFYPDPSATNVNEMWYCFHVYDVSFNTILENWPEEAPRIKAKMMDTGQFKRDVWSSEQSDAFGPINRLTKDGHTSVLDSSKGTPVGRAVQEGQTTLMEFWEIDVESGDMFLHYISNDVVLETIRNPLGPKVKEFPFKKVSYIDVDGEFWGIGLCQILEPLQLSINKRRQQIIDNLRILGQPPLVADKGAGLEEDIILGAPGEIININDGARVQWLQPPAMPPGLFQLQDMDKRDIETVSGVFDVVQGRTPTGIEAAAAIAELQDAAQTKIRAFVSNMEDALEDIARIMLTLVQSNYTDEKALLLMGEEAKEPELININSPITLDEAEAQIEEQIDILGVLESVERALDVTKGDFDVQLKAGSTLPISKSARLNEAILLFDRGIIGPDELLTAINHPRRREIIDKLEQQQAAASGQVPGLEGLGGGELPPEGAAQPGQAFPTELGGQGLGF